MEDYTELIRLLEQSVERSGEVIISNKTLLNVLKVAQRNNNKKTKALMDELSLTTNKSK